MLPSSARLRSDIFVAAYLRRSIVENVPAVMRRRGAAEAGAIFLKIDRLDGTADLYGPAPQTLSADDGERRFLPAMRAMPALSFEVEERLAKEIAFDPDLWIIEADAADGRHFLDLAEGEGT